MTDAKQRRLEWQRQQRQMAIDNGLCVACKSATVAEGDRMCGPCRVRQRGYVQKCHRKQKALKELRQMAEAAIEHPVESSSPKWWQVFEGLIKS